MSRKILFLWVAIFLYLVYPIVAKSENLPQNIPELNSSLTPEQTAGILIPDPVAAQELYDDWNHKQELIAKAEKLKGTKQGQCVVAVRKFLGVGRDEIQGMAKYTKTNSESPEVGAIIKLNMSRYGHVGVVLDDTENTVTYYDSNGQWTERAAIRTIDINDPRILGYKIINN